MTSSRPWSTLALIAFLLVAAVSVPAVSAVPDDASAASGAADLDTAKPLNQEQNNTSVVRHRNPEEVNADSDSGELEAYLQRRLASRLNRSSIQISQGDYQRARSLFGDQYNDLLEKYVDVASQNGNEQVVEQFQTAQTRQRSFAEALQAYHETYEAYQQAKQNGNEERAQKLARRLLRLSREVNQHGSELIDTYTALGNETDLEVENATAAIRTTMENVSQRRASIRAREFVATRLALHTANGSRISFTAPLTVSGRLTTANGTPLANRTVSFTIGSRHYQVPTDADGEFSFAYRPVTAPTGSTLLHVRYVPRNASRYLRSNATVRADVAATNATVHLETAPDTVSFGDRVRVSGRVSANHTPIPRVPIRVALGGTSLGTVNTTANGTFTLRVRLPMDVPAGERSLTVRSARPNRAIEVEPSNTTVEVKATRTKLTADVSATNASSVRVRGRLVTADGRPVVDQTVAVRIDGTTRATVRTNRNGRYRATIAIPRTESNQGERLSLAVMSTYTGRGNLEASNATATANLPPVQGGSEAGSTPVRTLVGFVTGAPYLTGGALLLVLAGAGVFVRRRRQQPEPAADVSGSLETGGTEPESSTARRSLLSTARDRLDDGDPDAAVEAAYAAVRQHLVNVRDIDRQDTHWEFYRTCRDAGIDAAAALRSLTQFYERAAFSREQASESDAREALDIATQLVTDAPSDQVDAAD